MIGVMRVEPVFVCNDVMWVESVSLCTRNVHALLIVSFARTTSHHLHCPHATHIHMHTLLSCNTHTCAHNTYTCAHNTHSSTTVLIQKRREKRCRYVRVTGEGGVGE